MAVSSTGRIFHQQGITSSPSNRAIKPASEGSEGSVGVTRPPLARETAAARPDVRYNHGRRPYLVATPMTDVTRILSAIEQGDAQAAEELVPLVYDELRRLAAAKMAQENPGQTLQATALVHEVYLRLVDVQKAQHWNSRGHFFGAAAEAMRRILVDRARRKCTQKQGGGLRRHPMEDVDIVAPEPSLDLLAVSEALGRFEQMDKVAADLVKLRYFAGLTIPQAAEALGISSTTADRYWAYARAWLHAELKKEERDAVG